MLAVKAERHGLKLKALTDYMNVSPSEPDDSNQHRGSGFLRLFCGFLQRQLEPAAMFPAPFSIEVELFRLRDDKQIIKDFIWSLKMNAGFPLKSPRSPPHCEPLEETAANLNAHQRGLDGRG